ncbi:bestrophin family protein [Okeania sp. KiyG1]|uniref:bestrophin family protein n=1 Tax=Okeania sp. KiyG1 TaxID=2720165 RepID=UPI00192225C1|nr:bestrophin family ion channel [Okeania sp. KiyG1]
MFTNRVIDGRYREKREWLTVILKMRYSVIPAIILRVTFCGFFGFLISLLDYFNFPVTLPTKSSIVPSLVLGLLLVFRTNTAYERFWQGRQLWGKIVNTVRNFARQIWVSVEENEPADRKVKEEIIRLLVAFAIAGKLYLRGQSVNRELEGYMPKKWYEKLKTMNHPPIHIAFWISDYLQYQYERGCINPYQLTAMFKMLDRMVEALTGCEGILNTPIPLAYSIHLRQLLLIYCLSLPFQIVNEFHFWTGVVVALISFTVFGIEEIALEIENPFGYDPNDLPLDAICIAMHRNIEDLITLAPSAATRKLKVKS